jgi:hypothetical protein
MPAPASARRRSRAISLRHRPPPTCPAVTPPPPPQHTHTPHYVPPHTPPVFPPSSPPLPSPRPAPLWRAFGRSRALRVWCALRSSRGSSRPQAPRCSRPTPTAPSRFASSDDPPAVTGAAAALKGRVTFGCAASCGTSPRPRRSIRSRHPPPPVPLLPAQRPPV